MNLQKIYIALLERGAKRTYKRGIGLHRHRILPGYQGGEYAEGNIAYLTRKEHRLVHKLRYKLFGNVKELGASKQLGGKLTTQQLSEHSKLMTASLSKKQRLEYSRRGGLSLSKEQLSKAGKLGGASSVFKKTGFLRMSKEQLSKNGRTGALITITKKIGIHGLSEEQRLENCRLGGKATTVKNRENGTGFCGFSKEQRSKNGRLGGLSGGRKGGLKGGAAHKDRKWIRCKISGRLSRPTLSEGWLMVLTGNYEYRGKNEQLASQPGLLEHLSIFSPSLFMGDEA
jgi:hypothetical protein